MDGGAVIEVLGRDGQVRRCQRIEAWPLTIGRSPACDLVLDDVHLAACHASLDLREGRPVLGLLDSVNGGWLGRQRLRAGESQVLGPNALFQLGATQLRLRRAADPLAAEQPLLQRPAVPRHGALLPALLLGWLFLLWFDQWSALNPDSPWIDYAPAVLAPLGLLLAWAALWALVTQLFQHRFPFLAHLWRALLGVAGLHVLSFLLPLLAYAFSARWLLVLDALLFPAGLVALLWWQAVLVWPAARRALAFGLAGLLLGGLGLMVAKRQEQQYWFGPPYLAALPPPQMRLVSPRAPEQLIDSLRPLREQLARQAGRDNDQPAAEGED